MPIKNKNYDGVRLYRKYNGKKGKYSCVLNVSLKEATSLGFVDDNGLSLPLYKKVIDNKLFVSTNSFEDSKPIKLSPKKNGSGYISSYTLSVSCKEARAIGLLIEFKTTYDGLKTVTTIAKKDTFNNQLVVSCAFPQSSYDLCSLLDSFKLSGRRLNKKTLLDLLFFIEGNSESYQKQLNGIYDSIRVGKKRTRTLVMYQGQYTFFTFLVEFNGRSNIIKDYFSITPSDIDFF